MRMDNKIVPLDYGVCNMRGRLNVIIFDPQKHMNVLFHFEDESDGDTFFTA